MSGWHGREDLLLKIIQMAYDAPDDCAMVRSVFTAMRKLMSFASGVFLPVSPDTLELQPGLCFDCSEADMATYLAHYAPFDPFVLRQPGPALLNRSVRLSDPTFRALGQTIVEIKSGDFLEVPVIRLRTSTIHHTALCRL